MKGGAATVEEYLAQLPEDRRAAVEAVRAVILANLPPGFKEGIQYGILGYCIPLERYPTTYNGQPLGYVALASQKNYLSLYLMNVYGPREEPFRAAYAASGKKLDMGKSCVRFKKVEDLALDVIARQIAADSVESFIGYCEAARSASPSGRGRSSRP